MKPYPYKSSDITKRVYTYRLSRARRMVENTFGIIATRFHVLLKSMNLQPDKAQLFVQASVVLHNYLLKESPRVYTPSGTLDEDQDGNVALGYWRDEFNPAGTLHNISQQGSNHHSLSAREIQQKFAEYFVSTRRELSWQYQHACFIAHIPRNNNLDASSFLEARKLSTSYTATWFSAGHFHSQTFVFFF